MMKCVWCNGKAKSCLRCGGTGRFEVTTNDLMQSEDLVWLTAMDHLHKDVTTKTVRKVMANIAEGREAHKDMFDSRSNRMFDRLIQLLKRENLVVFNKKDRRWGLTQHGGKLWFGGTPNESESVIAKMWEGK